MKNVWMNLTFDMNNRPYLWVITEDNDPTHRCYTTLLLDETHVMIKFLDPYALGIVFDYHSDRSVMHSVTMID